MSTQPTSSSKLSFVFALACIFATILLLECPFTLASIKLSGGTQASESEFAGIVSIQYQSAADQAPSHFCGASIVNARYIITAAHCVQGVDISKLVVVAGTSNNNCYKDTSGRCIVRTVSQVVPHPNFDVYSITNDIALVQLSQDLPLVTMSSKVKSFKLESGVVPFGAQLQIAGWGATQNQGSSVNNLQKGQIPLQTTSVCSQKQLTISGPAQMCIGAGGSAQGIDICSGDAGSPAFYLNSRDSNAPVLVGIVSYGPAGCGGNNVGVYANVTNYLPWIRSVTSDVFLSSYTSGSTPIPTPAPSPRPNINTDQCTC
ncbi:hypothetical protein FDP41_009196 [Naegleria fowleri]|uniref:Peptidase S1 domain-containing protein n=1 Tax=Naegleria fowleri TaxID=5763 RepID=A0A6A5AWT5_NAEFO|nr:uncharacterized protein FDP41_009196 [Naegleria fowleri]KAF0972293.1 hypothetical protein FDP41_009196 [Naegleria fowleri]CAG4708877.1 unnamed protein product [Naegleria fowleri]